MRTLFTKIMLWFVATIAITFIGLAVIPAIGINDPARRPPMARAFSFTFIRRTRFTRSRASALAAFGRHEREACRRCLSPTEGAIC